MIKTNREIDYQAAPYGHIATIPAGTPCETANNLPLKDGRPQYWVQDWEGMTNNEYSWQRNYGFLVDAADVEIVDCDCTCEGCGQVHRYEDDDMDGDHASALASAGFGTDEDYEHNSIDDCENWHGDSDGSVGCD